MVLSVLCLAVVANAELVNVFCTGDMEQSEQEWPQPIYWSSHGTQPGQGTVSASTDTPTGTGHSLMVTGWDFEDYDYDTYSHEYSRDENLWVIQQGLANKEVTVSFDYKGDIYLRMQDGGGVASNSAIWARVTQWTHHEFTFTTDPATTHLSFYLYDNSGAGNSAYLDNLQVLVEMEGSTLLVGDANRDGVVSAGDYASVQANFGNTGAPNDPELFGDASLNGQVSAGDYASVQANFGNVAGGGSIPEPATIWILSIAGLSILRPRRKRKN